MAFAQLNVGGGSWVGGGWNGGKPIIIFPNTGGGTNGGGTSGGTVGSGTVGGGTNPGTGTGAGNTIPGRSVAVEVVEAYANFDMNQIEVCFSRPVGVVTIAVTNAMGQTLSIYTCNTEAEWYVQLPLPNAEGHYTLTIDGSDYYGAGEFDL